MSRKPSSDELFGTPSIASQLSEQARRPEHHEAKRSDLGLAERVDSRRENEEEE